MHSNIKIAVIFVLKQKCNGIDRSAKQKYLLVPHKYEVAACIVIEMNTTKERKKPVCISSVWKNKISLFEVCFFILCIRICIYSFCFASILLNFPSKYKFYFIAWYVWKHEILWFSPIVFIIRLRIFQLFTWSVGFTTFGRSADWNTISSRCSNVASDVVKLSIGFTCLGRSAGIYFCFSGVIKSPSPVRKLSSGLIGERFSHGPKNENQNENYSIVEICSMK